MAIEIIVTSAVTASIVSALVVLINGHLERRNRRNEMIFNIAFNLATERTKFVFEVAKASNRRAEFQDTIMLMETYYKWAKVLYEKGELPQDAHEQARKR